MEEQQIPDRYKPGFKQLLSIDSKTVEKLINALRQASPSLLIEDLASAVASQVQVLTVEEVVDIIEALISLYNFRDYTGTSIDDLVKSISQAVQDDEELPDISDKQKQELEQRLTTFLEFDGVLSVTSKAIEVIRDHERVFTRSRVLTDMRPIFESDLEKGPAGIAIVHMLKIEYADSDRKHEFFVALDSIDLEQLREQLDRADRKAKAIELMLNQANITFLNYRDVE
ncbi:hypothetical protein CDG77_04880 [Nostoc sp. 'Peltigera membranacea cyanobiont' 213]|uniref:hypothetical protein n=1 Tax=Nostoc cyanobionts TaxID=3123326 RepID=UPI000B956DDB|nr:MULTISPECIES: hypothetical protein [unclassified Nostoc]AVH67853.1 hypothetical protein NPM_6469 [Nostoc sp. 'Peltigera membranacea cyanobiont' N6]OYD98622.1 hypothetical protein CDG77_04880 [Nostoc sp. 'Peltigera membranacea cyanobiont' 213]